MFCNFYRSTVGKKVVMALTGLVMIGFVIGHMAGNLKVFLGFDAEGISALDHYALHLRQIGEELLGYENFLWLARGGLIVAVILHVMSALSLAKRNSVSRSQGYAVTKYNSASIASLTMKVGGVVLLGFIIFHILHFTTGTLHTHGFKEGFVYENVYNAFQHGWVVALYVIAMSSLCLHLYHGSWSMFQTLGIDSKGWNCTLRLIAKSIAVVVAVGFMAVPVSFFAGLMPAPTGKSVTYPHGH
jgi:succinate dehydrogenase / fumarate reductase cytochrome b subunit